MKAHRWKTIPAWLAAASLVLAIGAMPSQAAPAAGSPLCQTRVRQDEPVNISAQGETGINQT
jgi:hypothetical protein